MGERFLPLRAHERLPGGKEPRSFQIEMDPQLMQGLMHLLDQSLLQAGWREPFVPVVAVEPAAEDDASRSRHLH